MIIPIPCKLGEKVLCNGRMLVFCGVDWFRWSSGMEYTYFFETGHSWHETDFYTGDGAGMSKYIEVDNVLLSLDSVQMRSTFVWLPMRNPLSGN